MSEENGFAHHIEYGSKSDDPSYWRPEAEPSELVARMLAPLAFAAMILALLTGCKQAEQPALKIERRILTPKFIAGPAGSAEVTLPPRKLTPTLPPPVAHPKPTPFGEVPPP